MPLGIPCKAKAPQWHLSWALGSTSGCSAWPVQHPTVSVELAASGDGSLHEICMQCKLVTGLCIAYMLMSSQPCLRLLSRA